MSKTAAYSSNLPRPTDFILPGFTSLLGGALVFVVLLIAGVLVHDSAFAGKIYTGVSVEGIDLSGKTPAEAAALLTKQLAYPTRGRILLRDGDKLWLASPADLGFYLNPEVTAMAAQQIGRTGGPVSRVVDRFKVWYTGESLPPQYVFDERAAAAYLASLAAQTDEALVEASLGVEGTEVVVRPGKVGRSLDIPATLEGLRAQLQSLKDGEVPLVIRDLPPAILNVDEQAEVARKILSAPLVLSVPDAKEGDPGPWTFEPADLAKMLTIERVSAPDGDKYQVGLQADSLRPFLEKQAPKLVRERRDARFIFNDDTKKLEVIEPSLTGRSLAVDGTIQAINQKLMAGEHNIPLELVIAKPDIDDDTTAKELGITELVSSQTSYFYGSSRERVQNIQTASARFHGVLVPPGATFSMANILGDVSLDNGYAEALIIFGGRTIKGVGGGVCQVSTTLFRTVFFGGYPVVERNPHAYRVGYYEQTRSGGYDPDLAGLDATVFVPVVDFKFTNDSKNWLLMETYVNPAASTLIWKFYSTSDGRKVEWTTTGPQNVVEPPKPLYEENPDLAKGVVKQVDWEAQGADVTVTRTVTRDGQVIDQDTFFTQYMPWQAIYQYGPGTEGMPPDKKSKDK